MYIISSNFKAGRKKKCITNCGMIESMEHNFYCEQLNDVIQTKKYNNIYNGNSEEQVTIFKILQNNLRKREQIMNDIPSDPSVDPLLKQ